MFKLLALLTVVVACVCQKPTVPIEVPLPYTRQASNSQYTGENLNGLASPPVAATAVGREVTLETRVPVSNPKLAAAPLRRDITNPCSIYVCYKTEEEVYANPAQGYCSGILPIEVSAWYPVVNGLKPYLCMYLDTNVTYEINKVISVIG